MNDIKYYKNVMEFYHQYIFLSDSSRLHTSILRGILYQPITNMHTILSHYILHYISNLLLVVKYQNFLPSVAGSDRTMYIYLRPICEFYWNFLTNSNFFKRMQANPLISLFFLSSVWI